MKKKIIKVCKNCPEFGNHLHYHGKLYAVSNEKSEVEFIEFDGIKELNKLRMENECL